MKTQIVVVGGGAGGLELVRRLGAKLGRDDYDIILLERNSTHIWKPLLHEVAAGALDANLDEVGYRSHGYRWKYRFFLGSLEAIDRDARQVVVAPLIDEDGTEIVGRHRIRYDYLILSLGAVSDDFGTPGVREHCILLEDRKQADRFRQKLLNHCLRVSRTMSVTPNDDARVGVVIVGERTGAALERARRSGQRVAHTIRRGLEMDREQARTELDSFKTDINLADYVRSLGFQIDGQKSSRNSFVFGDRDGAKIVVSRRDNGHWTYFSVNDSSDKGTIIDFLQRRQKVSLAEVRKTLRAWTGLKLASPQPIQNSNIASPKARARSADFLSDWNCLSMATEEHDFLKTRRVGQAITSNRFRDAVRSDSFGNAVFPYRDIDGRMTGLERRNHNYKRFLAGGVRTVWTSEAKSEDRRLVICESPLDCLAHYLLYSDNHARYLATGGALSPKQLRQLNELIRQLPGLQIAIATDADEAGDSFAAAIRASLPESSSIIRERPEGGKDWCDILAAMEDNGGPGPGKPKGPQ